MDILGLMFVGIALFLGASAGEWIIHRTGKKAIGWPVGILVFAVTLVVLRGLI